MLNKTIGVIEMKAKIVYIEQEKAIRINEILEAEKEFIKYGKKKK